MWSIEATCKFSVAHSLISAEGNTVLEAPFLHNMPLIAGNHKEKAALRRNQLKTRFFRDPSFLGFGCCRPWLRSAQWVQTQSCALESPVSGSHLRGAHHLCVQHSSYRRHTQTVCNGIIFSIRKRIIFLFPLSLLCTKAQRPCVCTPATFPRGN